MPLKRPALAAQFFGGRLHNRIEFHDFERERAALLREAEADADPDEKPVTIIHVLIEEKESEV